MEEKELPFEYKHMEEETKGFDITSLKKSVFGSTVMMPGSGEMIALKTVLQVLDNFVLVSSGTGAVIASAGIEVPFVAAGRKAFAFAKGLSRATDKKVVVFAGDGATLESLPSLMRSNDNILYICYNNSKNPRQLAGMMPGYAATASVAYFEDFVRKLRKAFAYNGLSYIEILTPNPSWGYEPANTIEIAELATDCLIWPVYEVENGSTSITKRPDREEPVARFFSALKGKTSESEIRAAQEEAGRNWKFLQKQ